MMIVMTKMPMMMTNMMMTKARYDDDCDVDNAALYHLILDNSFNLKLPSAKRQDSHKTLLNFFTLDFEISILLNIGPHVGEKIGSPEETKQKRCLIK